MPTADFDFQIEEGVDVPFAALAKASSHAFPWDKMKPGTSFVIPKQYWLDRKMEEGHYSPQKVKERVRMNFRGWQDQDKGNRGKLMIAFRPCAEKEGGAADALRMWVLDAGAVARTKLKKKKSVADKKKAAENK